MHPGANVSSICVRCTSVSPPSETPKREGSTAWRSQRATSGDRSRSRGDPCRATRLYTDAGGRRSRREPLDVRSPRSAGHRDRRDAVGHKASPRRRARAIDRRAATASSRAVSAGEPGAAARPRAGPHRPHPSRARGRTDTPRDRRRAQPSTRPDRPRRPAMVAVNRTCGPSSISGL
jgi:hypothetical protein